MERVVTLKTNRSFYSVKEAADDSITVEEFINWLKEFNPKDKIVFSNDGGYTYGYIKERVINEKWYENTD